MNRIETHSLFINPYREISPDPQSATIDAIAKKNISTPHQSKTMNWTDRVVEWGKMRLFTDYEKGLVAANTGTWLVDKGVSFVVGGMQGSIIADGLFHLPLLHSGIFTSIPHYLKLILIPSYIFFLIIGTIQGIFELVNLNKAVQLLKNIEKGKSQSQGLDWVKSHYFTLNPQETERIYEFVEKNLPSLDTDQKADSFDRIASRALEVKFETLKRRISPGLAEHVKTELNLILKNPQNPEMAARTQLLMDSVSKQVQNKILIHFFAIVAIGFTLISVIGVLSGVGTVPFFLAINIIMGTFAVMRFIVLKCYFEKEAANFEEKLSKLHSVQNPAIEVAS